MKRHHHHEDRLVSYKGIEIYYQQWIPEQRRCQVLLLHGFGEHSSRYGELANALANAGYGVLSLDYQGHGKSGGKRGVLDHFTGIYDDIDRVVEQAVSHEGKKLIVLGHSLGGLVALGWMLRNPAHVGCLILSSPLLGFALKIPFWKQALSKAFCYVLPSFTFHAKVDPTVLTHDPKKRKEYVTDPLIHQWANGNAFYGMKQEMQKVLKNADKIQCPVLMLLAGEDHVVSLKKSLEFFEALPSEQKARKVYPTLYHEIFNELGREKIYAEVVHWLKDAVPSCPTKNDTKG